MKKGLVQVVLGVVALSVTAVASAQVKPEDQIRFRQAGYSFAAWNMGKIKANLDGNFNKDQVAAAATTIAAIANSGMGALFGPGTEKAVGNRQTAVKPELFQNMPEVARLAGDFSSAANKLSAAAATGDQAAVKAAFGEVGQTCKACHDKFRKE